ncbi:branched-chain amino acid ABC transporter ATP-binding protein/permease [uncultured Paenalcaligenes sp.]|uniref:branched-chain amino acid ABC transporter ATP-binding protein/permease n=1 Tax=uncultured Paenalcaligenes sp. TaxID=1588925 RepID=UPI00260E4DC7|nr:branched-chain amino acid ABC transporter ATP-binding protein/permease [uncultured Paenalcaligenes sp.]
MNRRIAMPVILVVLCALIAPQVLPEYYLSLLNYVGLYSIVGLGMVLLTGVGGLTSFGQAAFVGIGAYATAVLTANMGMSPWMGLLAGLVITGLIATLLGLLTLRLSGHYLPIGTLAWGISLYYLFGNLPNLGGFSGISHLPAISIFGWTLTSSQDFGVLIWFIVGGVMWLLSNLLDSREGRAIRALFGGSVMAEAMGVNTGRSKLLIFIYAALLAAVSGWLYAHMQRFVNPSPFSINMGIEYLFMILLGGASTLGGAVVGAIMVTGLKEWLQDILPLIFGQNGNFEAIFFGALIILCLLYARQGLWPVIVSRVRFLYPQNRDVSKLKQAKALPQREPLAVGQPLLVAEGVTKRFGGLVANNNMSLNIKTGQITALIGPNGAGKSTLFNLLTGLLPLTSGQIEFRGQRIDGMSSRKIASLGVSRSFQHVRLIPTMSVLENVALGAHMRGEAGYIRSGLHAERTEENALLAEAARQIERVGLGKHMHESAGSLALGQQRIVEIARALCADPYLLLLDEPAAGLRHLEKQALADLLMRLRAEGMAVLMVEHDMDFLMGLADYVVVMEFGQKLAEGLPQEIQENPKVLAAYLGGEDE